MRNFDFLRLFNNNSNSNKANQQRRGRTCRFEELEGREMLSVSPWSLLDEGFTTSLSPVEPGFITSPLPRRGEGDTICCVCNLPSPLPPFSRRLLPRLKMPMPTTWQSITISSLAAVKMVTLRGIPKGESPQLLLKMLGLSALSTCLGSRHWNFFFAKTTT